MVGRRLLRLLRCTDAVPLPGCVMVMLTSRLGEVHKRLDDGSILDHEFPHIARSGPAGLLASSKNKGLSTRGIFRLSVIFIRLRERNQPDMVSIAIAVGVDRI